MAAAMGIVEKLILHGRPGGLFKDFNAQDFGLYLIWLKKPCLLKASH